MASQYNAADPADISAAGKSADWRRTADLVAMANVLQSPDGQRVLGLVLKECHLYESSLAIEPVVMARLEGERRIGLAVRAYIESVKPGAYDDLNRALAETAAQEKRETERLVEVSRERARALPGANAPRIEGSPG